MPLNSRHSYITTNFGAVAVSLPSQGITGLQVLRIHLKHGNWKKIHVFRAWI